MIWYFVPSMTKSEVNIWSALVITIVGWVFLFQSIFGRGLNTKLFLIDSLDEGLNRNLQIFKPCNFDFCHISSMHEPPGWFENRVQPFHVRHTLPNIKDSIDIKFSNKFCRVRYGVLQLIKTSHLSTKLIYLSTL